MSTTKAGAFVLLRWGPDYEPDSDHVLAVALIDFDGESVIKLYYESILMGTKKKFDETRFVIWLEDAGYIRILFEEKGECLDWSI